jgi:hypothetical protein
MRRISYFWNLKLFFIYFIATIDLQSNEENVFLTSNSTSVDSRIISNEQVFKEHTVFKPEKQANGQSVAKIKCEVRTNDAQVNWLRDEIPIPSGRDENSDEKFKIIDNGKEKVLIVNNVQTDDEGEYVCQSGRYRVTLLLTVNETTETVRTVSKEASDNRGKDDHELYFSDERSFRSTSTSRTTRTRRKLASYVKDMYVQEGIRKVELKCKVSHADTSVEWLRHNKPIDTASGKYELIARGAERILLIRNPTKADNGDYVCQSGKHRVVLTLNVNPGGLSDVKSVYSSEDEGSVTGGAGSNVFVSNRRIYSNNFPELNYYLSESANLRCQVKKDSEKVVWVKDNEKVIQSDSNKYATVDDGTSRVLVIKNLCDKDSGNYSCQSKANPAHQVHFKMNVKGKFFFLSFYVWNV